MKWLAENSPFHLFTNPNRFIFGHGVVIYHLLFRKIDNVALASKMYNK